MRHAGSAAFARALLAMYEVAYSGGCVAISYEERVDVAPAQEPRWARMQRELAVSRKILAATLDALVRKWGQREARLCLQSWWEHEGLGVSYRDLAHQTGWKQTVVFERVFATKCMVDDFLARFDRLDVEGFNAMQNEALRRGQKGPLRREAALYKAREAADGAAQAG